MATAAQQVIPQISGTCSPSLVLSRVPPGDCQEAVLINSNGILHTIKDGQSMAPTGASVLAGSVSVDACCAEGAVEFTRSLGLSCNTGCGSKFPLQELQPWDR